MLTDAQLFFDFFQKNKIDLDLISLDRVVTGDANGLGGKARCCYGIMASVLPLVGEA